MKSSQLVNVSITLDSSIEFRKIESENNCFYLVFKNGNKYKLKSNYISCTHDQKECLLTFSYLKKWQFKAIATITTWKNAVKKYLRNPLFCYTVTPVYKHFPMVFTLKNNVLEIKNYLGLKTSFYYEINNYKTLQYKDKKLYVESYDDVHMGSTLNNLKAIRYKTNHSKMDRRVFTDGILIQKNIKYEN